MSSRKAVLNSALESKPLSCRLTVHSQLSLAQLCLSHMGCTSLADDQSYGKPIGLLGTKH